MMDIIRIRLDSYAEGIVKHLSAKEYDSFKAVGVHGSYSDNYKQIYALMPVWFLNIEYEGSTYGIAVNGQTGKASGSLPISKKRVYSRAIGGAALDILKYLGLTLLIAFLADAAVMFLTGGSAADWFYYGMLAVMWLVASLTGLLIIVPIVKKKFSDSRFYGSVTIDKAPNIEEYINLKDQFKMEVRDTFIYMSSKMDDDNLKKFAEEPLSERVLKNIFK